MTTEPNPTPTTLERLTELRRNIGGLSSAAGMTLAALIDIVSELAREIERMKDARP